MIIILINVIIVGDLMVSARVELSFTDSSLLLLIEMRGWLFTSPTCCKVMLMMMIGDDFVLWLITFLVQCP